MRCIGFVILILCASACDQDPFNLSQRKVSGPYRLQRFEARLFYLVSAGAKVDGGGCLDGTVERIGWTNGFIFAKRRACFRGDPDGWMIIDVSKQSMAGPLSEAEFVKRYPSVRTFSAEEAWKKL